MSNTQINGTSTTAYVSLAERSDNSDDVEFSNPANYVYNSATTEFTAGSCKLKALSGGEITYPFTTAGNYSYSSSVIEVSSGIATLIGATNVYAQWHLNASTGSTASDSSGHGYDGSLKNMSAPTWIAGKLNNCLTFDGTDDYVDCGNIADFTHTTAFSVEAWVKTPTASRMIMARHNGTRGWFLFIAAGGEVMFRLSNNYGTNDLSVKSSGSIIDDAWHHVVGTYSGSNTTTDIHIYIDGSNDDDATVSHLTDTIQVGVNMRLGAWNAGLYLNGELDEVLVYSKELSSTEVTNRYNSGSGTEQEGVSTNDPEITPKTGFSFTSVLDTFTETANQPAGTGIKYQVSANDGTNWLYWNSTATAWQTITAGTSNSYYYANEANSASVIHTNIGSLTTSGIFLFRAFLHSTDGSDKPELDNIYVKDPITYSTDAQSVSMNYDIQPSVNSAYISVTQTATIPANTSIQYQYSVDSGASYNGSWLTKAQLESSLQSLTTSADGTDTLRVKIRLKADTNTVTPLMTNLNIVSDGGYERSGTYTSNIYDSNYLSQDWDTVAWNAVTPGGTSILIKARAGNDSATLGAYSSAYSNGDETNLVGKYIQWIAEFSSSSYKNTPELSELRIRRILPERIENNP